MTPSASIADPVPPADVLDSPAGLGHRFAEAVAAGDLDAMVELYAADAVVTLPEGREAAGTAAIRAAFEAALAAGTDLRVASVGRPIVSGPLACTTTVDADGRVHSQVARCEPDGTWRWIRDVSRLSGRAGRETAALG
jgi:ketosteroid isomerase-like protein